MSRSVLGLLLAVALPSAAEIHSAVDVFDGRRVMAWACDSERPAAKLTVHFAVPAATACRPPETTEGSDP